MDRVAHERRKSNGRGSEGKQTAYVETDRSQQIKW
jgi:hypothetical protein